MCMFLYLACSLYVSWWANMQPPDAEIAPVCSGGVDMVAALSAPASLGCVCIWEGGEEGE